MPKEAKPDRVWKQELSNYAVTKEFKKGAHPAKNSRWGIEKAKIDGCPVFNGSTGKDVFGREFKCTCGYQHKKNYPKRRLPNYSPTAQLQTVWMLCSRIFTSLFFV